MSRRFISLAIFVLLAAFAITACDSNGSGEPGAHTVKPDEAIAMIDRGERTIIDVRTPAEFSEAHVVGAINMSVEGADFGAQVAELDADQPYLVYCRSGNRSALAADQMAGAGIKDIADAGGLADLAGAGAPIK